ncbi:MAG: RluA family pseudouridine synthase [Flaviflexus sp.]|nr:RluA family pseudouridine synthase [Flaviflexus sp.]
MNYFDVPSSLVGERLDVAVSRLAGISRTKARDLITEGRVKVDGGKASPSHKISEGTVNIEIPEEDEVSPRGSADDIDIVHIDSDLVVINKPAGLAAHPTTGWQGPDVLGALRDAGVPTCPYGDNDRRGIVHRLDVGTSGVMVVAISERAYDRLKTAFFEREVDKIYHALVLGNPSPPSGTIDAPIGRDRKTAWKMSVLEGGREAITHFDTLETLSGASLLEVKIDTGRTHQIRVHMSAIGHPCLGDPRYGGAKAATDGLIRQWLHARRLTIPHPELGPTTYEADYPPELTEVLERIRREGR